METKVVTKKEMIEQFNKDFRMFKRFLKENGKYKFVMKYLFPQEVTLSVFRTKAIQNLYVCPIYDFRDVLHIIPTLGPSYHKLGTRHWEDNLSQLSTQLINYFRDNCGDRVNYIIKDVAAVSFEVF